MLRKLSKGNPALIKELINCELNTLYEWYYLMLIDELNVLLDNLAQLKYYTNQSNLNELKEEL